MMGFNHLDVKKRIHAVKGAPDDPITVRRIKHVMHGSYHALPVKVKHEFRSSSLPFCPILAIEANLKNNEVILEQESEWRNDFYTTIGTAVHEIWQNRMCRAAEHKDSVNVMPFGGWRCSHCLKELLPQFMPRKPCECSIIDGYDHTYTVDEFIKLRLAQNPNKIQTHDLLRAYADEYRTIGPYQQWYYVELGFDYEGLTGHVDFVEYYPDYDLWAVYDLKTASIEDVKKEDKRLPVVKNIFQIETYSIVLPKVFKEITHINEYILLYQARDSATKNYTYRVVWDADRERRAVKRLNRWLDGNDLVIDYLKEGAHDKNLFLEIIDQRPCFSEKSYIREMSDAFTYSSPGYCLHKKLCTTCESDVLARKLYTSLMESVEAHKERQ